MKTKHFLAVVIASTVSASCLAQQVKGLSVYIGFQNPEEMVGKKISTVVDWHCGPSSLNVATYNRGSFNIPLSRTNDLRNLKSLTFRVAEAGDVPTNAITGVTVGGNFIAPAVDGGGTSPSIVDTELAGIKYHGVGSIDGDLRTSFRPAHFEGANIRFDKDNPLTVNWYRTNLRTNIYYATHLDVELTSRDGCRSDSKLEMLVETYDGQFIHVPVGSIGDNARKSISKSLSLPIPVRGVSKVYFWFNNRTFDNNRQLPSDSLNQPDDADLTVSINGRVRGGSIPFLTSRRIRLTDWNNGEMTVTDALPYAYADDFLNQLVIWTQTGQKSMDWGGRGGNRMRLVATIRDTRGREVQMTNHSIEPESNGTLARGSFSSKSNATLVSNTREFPRNFRLSQLDSIKVMLQPIPIPRGRESFTETWDMTALALGMRKPGGSDDVFDHQCVFADMTLSDLFTYNMNVSAARGSSTRTYAFRREQIIYSLDYR